MEVRSNVLHVPCLRYLSGSHQDSNLNSVEHLLERSIVHRHSIHWSELLDKTRSLDGQRLIVNKGGGQALLLRDVSVRNVSQANLLPDAAEMGQEYRQEALCIVSNFLIDFDDDFETWLVMLRDIDDPGSPSPDVMGNDGSIDLQGRDGGDSIELEQHSATAIVFLGRSVCPSDCFPFGRVVRYSAMPSNCIPSTDSQLSPT